MNKIYKYKLSATDEQSIEMPEGAIALCVQVQNYEPCLWVRCNPDNPIVSRKIITHGTGHDIPEATGDYIGSYQLQDGALVFHVFEGRK